MQISFYKPTYRISSGDSERRITAPDTYYNVSNVTVFPDGMVIFNHTKNGISEFVATNLPYKIIGSEAELSTVKRGV